MQAIGEWHGGDRVGMIGGRPADAPGTEVREQIFTIAAAPGQYGERVAVE